MAPYDTIMRGRCHDSAPRLLPAGRCGTPVVMRHAALSRAEPRHRFTSAAHRTAIPQVQTQTHQRPHCAAYERDAIHPHAPPPKRPDPMAPTKRRPCAIDTSMHCCSHAGCAYRGWLGLGNLRAKESSQNKFSIFVSLMPCYTLGRIV